MKKLKKILLSILILFTINLSIGYSYADDIENNLATMKNEKINIQLFRFSGNDRYETSVILSDFISILGSQRIFLANGENFADALFGGPLAASYNSPILLTTKDKLPSIVERKIIDLKIKNLTILGGENSVSSEVEQKLINMGIKVDRIAGIDRFETARKISLKRGEVLQAKNGESIAYASGVNFADALAASPFIYYDDMNSTLPENNIPVLNYIPYNNESAKNDIRYIFGGINSIPDKAIENMKITTRFSGEDRYSTSVEIAKECEKKLNMKINTVFIASGDDFPDALSVGPIAARHGSVILLTSKDYLSPDVKSFLMKRNIQRINIIGGNSAISDSVENEIRMMYLRK